MTFKEFVKDAHSQVELFEMMWAKKQQGECPEKWPEDLPEEEWWDQFLAHLELSGKIEERM